jgi:hypothetical protein
MIRQPAVESALLAQLSLAVKQPDAPNRTDLVQNAALRTKPMRTNWVQTTIKHLSDDKRPRNLVAAFLFPLQPASPSPPAQ